ncbi:MAG TPA: ethanolamine ammonia-lyase subunit EutC [Tepidisphaeraceae bacterium]|jgi:ethanolamine ammonia-lyase small subunit
MENIAYTPDGWINLRRHTVARIALGRAGGSLPTREVLDFSIAHAAARDAVHAELDAEALRAKLAALELPILLLATAAPDRLTYLHRPDLGRRLDEASRETLKRARDSATETDVAILVGDGLSAPAAAAQAPAVLARLVPELRRRGLKRAPICIVRQARVAVEDEVGSLLGAKAAIILLGERPGLGANDSLGAYLVFGPRPGRTDAERNCVSNIRPAGLSPDAAAETIAYLVTESIRRRLSGVQLKDERNHGRLA